MEASARRGLSPTLDLQRPLRQTGGEAGNFTAFESQAHPPLWLPTSRTTSSTISQDGRSAYAAGSGVPAQRHCEFSGNKQTHKPANPAKEDDQRKCEPPGLTSEIRFPMKKTNAQTNNTSKERRHLDRSKINVNLDSARSASSAPWRSIRRNA